ncbi:MAG: aromatic amino acid lyase, partial [Aestuariibacter sp.]|nr:aromatic amino acid lyase [Aestuariibacter sp.]
MKQTLNLTPGQVTLADLCRVYREPVNLQLDRACKTRVDAAHEIVQQASEADAAVYGINTGF